jgi:hypothetical protein
MCAAVPTQVTAGMYGVLPFYLATFVVLIPLDLIPGEEEEPLLYTSKHQSESACSACCILLDQWGQWERLRSAGGGWVGDSAVQRMRDLLRGQPAGGN